jgi:2-polyprenyl-3-methyl-5-hydroxy-6-metoxy-1,4-benzoquinol methylase
VAFPTQHQFPWLWLLMQNLIGGNASKQAMAIEHYRGEKRVLEIGCSVGNISDAFRAFPDVSFTGIDIDSRAIEVARRRFRTKANFRFSLRSLVDLSDSGERFDYVLFAGILHHVDDRTGSQLLRDAVKCLGADGRLVIYEPEAPRPSDGWLLRYFCNHLEQGAFLRTSHGLRHLVEHSGIGIESFEDRMVSPGIVNRPHVARFNLLGATPALTGDALRA